MRKILLVGAVSIAVAAAPFATATDVGGSGPCASAAVIGTPSGAYQHARVLEPGSRGSVVEI
jgi:hypothetical protein